MARLPGGVLPDESILGDAPSLRSGRSVPSYEGGAAAGAAISKGAAALGEGLSDLGRGLAIRERTDDAFELSKAKAAFTTGKIQLDSEFEHDADYGTAETRYRERLDKLRTESSTAINNPKLRDRFGVLISDDVARGVAGIQRKVYGQTADTEIASAQNDLKTWQEKGLSSGDEAERAHLLTTGQQRIEGLKLKGYITAQQAQQMGRQWVEGYGKQWLETRAPEDRVAVLKPFVDQGSVVDRIINVESGGKATATNPKSSAVGAGQFISSTWLDLIKTARPDIAQGRDDKALLEMRTDPALSREMVKVLADRNAAYLKTRGLPTDSSAVYLAHFLGPQGAAAVLSADPSQPVSELVSKEAVKANASILSGKTAGSVIEWAAKKMGAGPTSGTPADFVPQADRVRMFRQSEREVLQNQTAAAVGRGEQLERQMIDARAGTAELPTRAEIEADPVLDEPRRNTLLRQYDQAAEGVRQAEMAMARFADPAAGPVNPYDKNERDMADVVYQRLGANEPALSAVVDKFKVLPASVGVGIRGGLASNDPKRAEGALQLASNLITRHPTIFTKVDGEQEIEKAVTTFRHKVEDLGFTAAEATQKYLESQTPEYRARVAARIKGEDINEVIKKNLTVDDIGKAFDESWWPGSPTVEVDPKLRLKAFQSYVGLFSDFYSESGDIGDAKKNAVRQLQKVYGVSKLTGSDVVMHLPPDRAPAYRDLPDPAKVISDQAIAAIKGSTGQDVSRDKIKFIPILGGVTSRAYLSGDPPPYQLSWQNSKGLWEFRPFFADPKPAREALTEERRQGLEAAAAREDRIRSHDPALWLRNKLFSGASAEEKAAKDAREVRQQGLTDQMGQRLGSAVDGPRKSIEDLR